MTTGKKLWLSNDVLLISLYPYIAAFINCAYQGRMQGRVLCLFLRAVNNGKFSVSELGYVRWNHDFQKKKTFALKGFNFL